MADGSLSIAGANTLDQATIRKWWGTRGNARLNCPVDQLIGWYLSEGADQGIRGDVAFAQAIIETGHFTNNDTTINNFAGIGHGNNSPSGFDFGDPQTGVRAHIQHLFMVVNGPGATLAHPKVGPSAPYQASTWSGLDGHWAVPGVGYGNTIVSVWSSMASGVAPASGPTAPGPVTAPPVIVYPTPPGATMPTFDPAFRAQATIDKLKL